MESPKCFQTLLEYQVLYIARFFSCFAQEMIIGWTVLQKASHSETAKLLPSIPFSALDRHRSFSADGRTNATTKHSTLSAIRAKPRTMKSVHWNLPCPQSSMMYSYCSDNSSSSDTELPAARDLALEQTQDSSCLVCFYTEDLMKDRNPTSD